MYATARDKWSVNLFGAGQHFLKTIYALILIPRPQNKTLYETDLLEVHSAQGIKGPLAV